jgi:phosphate transport system permease protein
MSTTIDPVELVEDAPAAGAEHVTSLPRPAGQPTPYEQRRRLGTVSLDGLLTSLGAAAAALSISLLLFGRLAPLSGRIGFVVVAFVFYVAIYALLVSLTDRGPAIADRVMTVLFTASATIAIFALGSVIVYTIAKGAGALNKTNLYTEDMSFAGPLDPLTVGGIQHAIVGTLIQMSLALLFTVPLGLTCAVYLNESRSRTAEFVRTVVTAMTALPSIVAGLFVFVFWVLILGYPRSGLAAAIAISIMMLPIIIRSADVVLRLVPGSLREASAALGAPQWRTVWHVVLPTARSGLSTAVILGMARGVGETAPVLLTAGFTAAMNTNPFESPMISLPLATYEFVRSPQPTVVARGFASATVLMIVVLVMFITARILGGRPAGHLSGRQRKRAARRSVRDLERITALQHAHTPTSVEVPVSEPASANGSVSPGGTAS